MKLVPFEVISSGCNALIVPFLQLLKGPMEILLCERVNDLRHSLFHLLNCLIMTASEPWGKPKVTGSKLWTIWRVRNCLDAHLGLWQGWSCGLVHCPGGNATEPILRVLVRRTFTASRRIISGTSGELCFGPSQRPAQLDGGGDPFPLELGAWFGLLE